MRVVSLLPAATEIVAALGAREMLAGVSHECDYPPDVMALPRVTTTCIDPSLPSGAIDRAMADARARGVPPVEPDLAALRRLAPDVVITQSLCDVCAVGEGDLRRVVAALQPAPRVVPLHAHDVAGVFRDIERAGEALGLKDRARQLVAALRSRLDRVRQSHSPRTTRPRTLVLEWLDPPYVAGHWVPELVEVAGGADVGNAPGQRSRAVAWRELRALAPDLVVVACCGFDAPRARRELELVTDPDALALLAASRVAVLDGQAYTSRPGPRLVDAAEQLAELIRA